MKVLPVVVLYNTSLSSCDSVNSLKNQNLSLLSIDRLFIYDNSPDASLNAGLNSKYDDLDVIYMHDVSNSGVSKAYNIAASYAAKNGFDWILLLDQDTVLPTGALEKYHQGMSDNPDLPVFSPILKTKQDVICSPCRYKFHRGFTPEHVPRGRASFKDFAPINSCMMVSTNKLIGVGGYNEGARLDFSDFQFIERLKKVYPDFFILDFVALQDFSNETTNLLSLKSRFKIYCECAKACERESFKDNFQYLVIVFLRMAKLTVRTKSFDFFKIFINHYIF